MKNWRKKIWRDGVFTFISILALYIGSGLLFTFMGVDGAFKKFPRHVALLIGIAVAMIMNKSMKLDKKLIYLLKMQEIQELC